MITRRGEYLRASLAPPEPLPEDVEALAEALYGVPLPSVARLVLADRQRAVEAERNACIEACSGERRDDDSYDPEVHAHNWAIDDCIGAIRARGDARGN